MKNRALAALVTILGLATVHAAANVIGFDERFVLAEDRAEALKELIPGTEEYYVYHALHYQQVGDFAQARRMIDAGVKQYQHTGRLRELENRQALLAYEQDADGTIRYLVEQLKPHFGHQRKQLKPEVKLATGLDPGAIETGRLMSRELRREQRNVDGFEPAAFDWLMEQDLTPDQRRDLVKRLPRPDYPGLAAFVAADLEYRQSGGFGSMDVHRMLLPDQLEELLKRDPELIRNTKFINVYLSKLQPPEGSNWQQDDALTLAYLERLEAFAARLPPARNSLKASIAFQRLTFERRQGRYDRDRFMAYIRFPRPVHYINPRYRNRPEFRGLEVDLQARFEGLTALPPIGQDESLVRDHLMHFLKDEADVSAFSEYIEQNYLRRLFAEAKIVNGIGDQEHWYAMLNPEEVKRLRDRVDLDLLPTNPAVLDRGEPVALDVAVKNVKELILKIYEINTVAYYQQHMQEVSTDIDLDGLVPNHQRKLTYTEPPLRRHLERLAFPEIDRPGVYVVELIGNGVSSRALVRKGQLRFTQRTGAAGHALRVFDEAGRPAPEATLWTGGRAYTPNDKGEILVPFAERVQSQKLLLIRDGVATLWNWVQRRESYTLNAAIHVERETLVAGETCRILVRPRLSVAGAAVDMGLLQEPVLTLRSTDIDGTSAEKQVAGFELFNDRESIYEFKVPQRLRTLEVTLSGQVANLSTGEKQDVVSRFSTAVNGIDSTEKIENLFLRHTADGYFLELRGRNGEPLAGRPVRIRLKNHFVREEVDLTLKTDPDGRIALGELEDIDRIDASATEETRVRVVLPVNATAGPVHYYATVGETLFIPLADPEMDDPASDLSLLEIRGGVAARDAIGRAGIEDGYIVLEGLEPGRYELAFRRDPRKFTIAVGKPIGTTDDRPTRLSRPGLQIGGTSLEGDHLLVHLQAATPDTRLHVAVSRYHHPADPQLLAPLPLPRPGIWTGLAPASVYLSGRQLGDEYRYIMERRSGTVFPGNMLTRPSLLLNPWKLQETSTGIDQARKGEAYDELAAPVAEMGVDADFIASDREHMVEADGFETLDFLARTSVLLENLKPDDDGVVAIPLEELGPGQQVHLYAVNAHSGVYRELALDKQEEQPRERRLVRYLDPASHYTQQKLIGVVAGGEAFKVNDILSAEFEVYDSLSRVHALLTALNEDATFAEFSFLLEWPSLSGTEKREKYSEYACHELHLFLMRKDPAFFEEVVRPYLSNKMDKTFLDHWLLGEDLDRYLEPWRYGRLNIVERVLLGQALDAERDAAARYVRDLYDLVPPDLERYNREFRFGLRSRGLDVGEALPGLADARRDRFYAETEAAGTAALAGQAAGKMLRVPAAPQAGVAGGTDAKPARARRLSSEERDISRGVQLARFADVADAYGELGEIGDLLGDLADRAQVRQLYRKLGPAEEWVENNYYHLPIEQQVGSLVEVNGFWKDYAAREPGAPFLSQHLTEAAGNFSEMMLVLAALDLPFEAAEHETSFADGAMTLVPGNDVIVFHQQVRPAESVAERLSILVSQNFFALNDRYRHEGNERFDKFVTEAFEAGRVYGCQVVLTNPTSTRRKVDVLTQIPAGALPVQGGMATRTRHLALEPYSTQTLEHFFYFPAPGTFEHYPVHASEGSEVIGHAEPFSFRVIEEVVEIDEESWEHVSQFGSDREVLRFLEQHNVHRLDLDLVAFRMRDKAYFRQVTDLLRGRHLYQPTLWAYSLHHNDPVTLREHLPHTAIADTSGRILESPLLSLHPVARHVYQHKEYWPLVNARTYRLGRDRKILNNEFFDQYTSFLENLRYRGSLANEDRMSLLVYLLLQDRVEEALAQFARVDGDELAMRMPYDYATAYLAFYREAPEEARTVAEAYADYPVERWRNLFRAVLSQCDEIAGGQGSGVIDEESRKETQTQLASTEPQLNLELRDGRLLLEHANLDRVTLNYYPMDIELLFSRQPFVQDVGEQFAMIRPNDSAVHDLPAGAAATDLAIPEAYRGRDVMIEAVGAGIRSRVAHYPNVLRVDLVENYGQVRVAHRESGKALPKVYVKVYARMPGGRVEFFKDGYTDLRGRFDYASLNTGEISDVDRFAVLVLSDEHGAVVREAAPPQM